MFAAEVAGVAAAKDVGVPALPAVMPGGYRLVFIFGEGVTGCADAQDGPARCHEFTKGGKLGFSGSTASDAEKEEICFFELFFQSCEIVFAVIESDDGDVVVLLEFVFKEGGEGGLGLVFPLGNEGENFEFYRISQR